MLEVGGTIRPGRVHLVLELLHVILHHCELLSVVQLGLTELRHAIMAGLTTAATAQTTAKAA
jgi:hypothetical protein